MDGQLVGAEYELEMSESFAKECVGILDKTITTGRENSDLAITDETRICKFFHDAKILIQILGPKMFYDYLQCSSVTSL